MLKVYDSTIRKSTEQDFLFEKVFERKPLFSEKHGSTVKLHLNKLQDLWIDETTQFGQNAQHHIWRKKVRAYEYKHPTLTARHGGGGVMIWAHFAATKNLSVYQSTLKSQQQIYNKMFEKEGVAIALPKSRHRLDWNTVGGPDESCGYVITWNKDNNVKKTGPKFLHNNVTNW